MRLRVLSPAALYLFSSLFALAESLPPQAAVAPLGSDADRQRETRVESWKDARFGLFIHFGLYAILGRGEWVQWNEQIPINEYARLAEQFGPEPSAPQQWAEAAKAAGAKYTVLTSRHHDGFCLFEDQGNSFTTFATSAHRDLVADYAQAARNAGLKVGLYYSPLDWRFPGFFFPDLQRPSAIAMRDQYHRQMQALLSKYGKIDILWFDGGETDWLNFGGDWSVVQDGAKWERRPWGKGHYKGGFSWQHDKVYEAIRRLQPDTVLNGRADMLEDFHSREGDDSLGDFDNQKPWELCTTLAGAWGYQPGVKPKPLQDCIRLLVKVAGRDGNLILNVGPRPDGRIEADQLERLKEIGAWLGRYGQSIYGTRGGPFLPGDYGVSTHRDRTIYLHILNWRDSTCTLPKLPAKILKATALTGGEVTCIQIENEIQLKLALASQDPIDTIIALDLDVVASSLALVPVQQTQQ